MAQGLLYGAWQTDRLLRQSYNNACSEVSRLAQRGIVCRIVPTQSHIAGSLHTVGYDVEIDTEATAERQNTPYTPRFEPWVQATPTVNKNTFFKPED